MTAPAPLPPKRYHWEEWSDDEYGWNSDTGAPGIVQFASAVSTWACMQRRPVSVAEAASVFNVDPVRVEQAMDEGVHMTFLTGPRDDFSKLMIEHDGE